MNVRARQSGKWPVERHRGVADGGMVQRKVFDELHVRPLPAGEDAPARSVEGPPLHSLPPTLARFERVPFTPDSMPPGLCRWKVAYHHLRRAHRPRDQLSGIIKVEQFQVARKAVGTQCSSGPRQNGKCEHRVPPRCEVAEHFPYRGGRLGGDVPDEVIGVIDPSTTLRAMFVLRVTWLAASGGR